MSEKPKRTLQDVQSDIAQIAQKVGVLVYQMERELPREIEKLYNQLFDLDGEGQKLFKAQQQEQFEVQEAAKKDTDDTKASMNGAEHPEPPIPPTPPKEGPSLQVVN